MSDDEIVEHLDDAFDRGEIGLTMHEFVCTEPWDGDQPAEWRCCHCGLPREDVGHLSAPWDEHCQPEGTDLTARLRARVKMREARPGTYTLTDTELMFEAADRIEELEADNLRRAIGLAKSLTPEDIGMVSVAPTVAGSQFDKLWRWVDR